MKIRRNYYLPRDIDQALELAAADLYTDKSPLVAKALAFYLPTISTLPKVAELCASEEKAAA